VRDGPALLLAERQPILLGPPHRPVYLDGAHAVPARRRQRRPGLLHALLDREHLARREAVPPAPVLAQPHQRRARLHPCHHLRELLRPVRVPRHEAGEVVPGEGGLLPRQRVQRQRGVRRDALAVPARDSAVLGPPLRLLAPLRPALPCRSYLVLRLKGDALRRQGAVINAGVVPQIVQPRVRPLRPPLPPVDEKLRAVPVPRLRPEPVALHAAHRQHDVRVRLRLAVGAPAPVHVQVRHHPARDELLAHEVLRQRDRLGPRQLARQRHLHVARELRIAPALARLHLVPQRRAVAPPRRGAFGQEDLRMHDAGLGREVVVAPQPLIGQPLRRAIRRSGNGAAARCTGNHLGREVVDRHARKTTGAGLLWPSQTVSVPRTSQSDV
jgi:hypothetical protein